MKVTVSFQLDLKDTNYNVSKVKFIPVCLQNLGSWFNQLHLHQLEKRLSELASKVGCSKEIIQSLLEHQEQDIKLSEQLFHNYQVEGITEDGHEFLFSHKEPGYNEITTVDGVEVHLEPYDGD